MRSNSLLSTFSRLRLTVFGLTIVGLTWTAASHSEPKAAAGYRIDTLVPGSEFCGVHGLGTDAGDNLYAGSVVGQRVYRVDTTSGNAEVIVDPPMGNADDMEFLPDGTLVWTAISQNEVRAKKPGGEPYTLAPGIVSVNSIAYDTENKRLYVAQVFGGDGLWELDPAGEKPPHNIINDMGGLNGFDVGPDGMIYGPLWFKNRVVKINPDTGDLTTVADGFHTPAAANFDSQWNLYVLDTATGNIYRVDYKTGDKEVFVTLKSSLDNLAIDSNDQLYVSNMADNSIQKIDIASKTISSVVEGGLSCPTAMSVVDGTDGDDQLYVADIFAFRSINGRTGEVTDLGRAHEADTPVHYSSGVGASEKYIYVISSSGLQRYRRDDFSLLDEWQQIPGVQAVVETADDNLLVLHGRGSTLSLAQPTLMNEYIVITDQLNNAVAMSTLMNDTLYFTQRDAQGNGSVVSVNINSGEIEIVADQLDRPAGLDTTDDGKLVIMQGSPASLLLIDPATGEQKTIAKDIPVGRLSPEQGSSASGVAVSEDFIYVLNDRDNEIYKIGREQ